MAKYATFLYNEDTYGSSGGVFPISDLDRVPWIFKDVVSNDEYEFAINPNTADVPSHKKRISTQYTAAGAAINFEGRPEPQTFSFSGTILSEDHYNIMVEWTSKKTQINLSDDLGRKYWIYITNFSPTRNYSSQFPWRHEYTAQATVISWE